MNIFAKTRDMPVSYQDFVLSHKYFGTPLPRDASERMRLAPQVYANIRQMGGRPSGLSQGLSAIGRGLAVLGGAGAAIGVANSLFNKPSDNYKQAVTGNQTTTGKVARKEAQTTFDDAYSTSSEEYTGETASSRSSRSRSGGFSNDYDASSQVVDVDATPVADRAQDFLKSTQTKGLLTGFSGGGQYDSPVGPYSVGATRGGTQYEDTVGPHSLESAAGIEQKPRMAKLGGSEFSQALRYGDPAANVAAAKAENEAALRGDSTPQFDVRYYGTSKRLDEQQNKRQSQINKIEQSILKSGGNVLDDQMKGAMERDTYIPPLSKQVDEFILDTKKDLPEKKTPEVSDIGKGRQILSDVGNAAFKAMAQGGELGRQAAEQTPDFDLSEIENDPALKEIGMREEPKDRSPRGVIPPDRSGTIKKTDLGAIGDIISEKQSDNPILGGLQAIGKVARTADKLGRRAVEEIADKGQEDRRKFAKYKETMRKAQAFKEIADERENKKDSE